MLATSHAHALNSGITYHGRLVQPDGVTPVTGVVQFKLQLRTPDSSDCLMYEEWQSIDLTGTNGIFALTLNDGSGTRHDSSGYTIDQIFGNRGTFSFAGGTCSGSSSYTPSIGDGRNLKVTFQTAAMVVAESMPLQSLNFAPLAIEAKQISGFQAENILRFAKSDGTLVNTSPLNDVEYAALVSLVDGTSTVYAKVGNATNGTPIYSTSAGTIGSTAVGDVWLDTSSPGHDVLKINTDSGVQTIGLSTTGFINAITAGTGLSVSTSNGTATVGIAAGGVGSTELANGAVTTAKIASGTILGSNLDAGIVIATTGTVSAAGIGTRGLSLSNSQAPTPNSVNITVPSSLFTNYSLVLPNSPGTSGQVLKTDGSGNLSWINPSSGSVTSVTAAATSGNPIVVLGTSAPTIDIGKADLTHNGYLSAGDYSSFVNKASSSLASGTIFVGNASGVATGVAVSGDATLSNTGVMRVIGLQGVGIGTTAPSSAGQLLRYDGSSYNAGFLSMADIRSTTLPGTTIFPTTSCAASKALSWSSLIDAFTCQDIAISSNQVSGLGTAAYLNVGVGSNSVVQLDSSSKLPAVDGSQLTNLNASSLTSGTIPSARLPSSATFWQAAAGGAIDYTSGDVGIGTSTPSALLQLGAGTAAAGGAPLKFTAGAVMTTPENGALEYDGANLYITTAGVRRTVASTTTSNDFSNVGSITGSGALPITAGGTNQNLVLSGSGAGVVTTASQLTVTNTTASISTTTGAAMVSGGLGVAGRVNAAVVAAANGTAALPAHTFISDLTSGMFSPSITQLAFSSNGAERMRVDASGNVGIGTTAPSSALDISGALTARGVAAPALSSAGQGRIYFDSATNTFQVSQNGGAFATLATSGGTGGGQTSTSALTYNTNSDGAGSDGGYNFQANGANLFTLANNGDAVFSSATASTSGATGAVKIAGGIGVAGDIFGGATINAATTVNAATSVVSPQIYGATTAIGSIKIDGTSNATAGNVLLATAGGNVGIGTTAPAYKLDVAGIIRSSTGGVMFPDGTTQTTAANGSASPALSALSAATATNTIDSQNFAQTWNWSTASTQTPFSVNANALTTGSMLSLATSNSSVNSTNGLLYVANTGASTNGMVARIQSSSAAQSGLSVLANGNVGIGTTAPAYKLDVAGTIRSSTGGIMFPDGTTQTTAAAGSSNTFVNGGNAFGAAAVLGTSDSNTLNIKTNNVSRMFLDTSGNVGIGTTAPAYPLQVAGTVGATGFLLSGSNAHYIYDAGTDNIGLRVNSGTTADAYFGFKSISTVPTVDGPGGTLALATGGTRRLSIDSTGNVGIGTTAPSWPLQVQFNSSTGSGLLLNNTNTSAQTNINFAVNGTATGTIRSDSAGNMVLSPGLSGVMYYGLDNAATTGHWFSAGGSERMRINSSGNVGIGTTAPGVKLDVAGSLRVGDSGETCAGGNFAGTVRYNSGSIQFCNGTTWTALGAGGGGGTVTSVNAGTGITITGTAAAPIVNMAFTPVNKAGDTGVGSLGFTSGNYINFPNANQSDGNDGKIGAGLFAEGLNIVGAQTVAGNGRKITTYGQIYDSGGATYWNSSNLTNLNQLTNGPGYLTSVSSGQVTGALGYTPVNKAGDTMTGRLALSSSGFVAAEKDDISARTDSGFFQTSNGQTSTGWPVSDSNWWHLMSATHTNDANYFSMQFAGSFFDSNSVYYRATMNNGNTGWNKLWHSGNLTNLNQLANGPGYLTSVSSGQVTGALGYTPLNKAGDTATGPEYFQSNKGSSSTVGANNYYTLEAYSSDGGAAGMSFHRAGNYAVNLGLDPDNVMRIGGWSAGANRWQLDMSGNETIAGSFGLNGNISFANANPTISASSYFVAPGGAYFNSGTVYTEAPIQARGGIHNDGASYLTISGGTSGTAYFPGNIGVATASPSQPLEVNGNILADGTLMSNGGVVVSGQQVIDSGAGWHRTYGNTGWYNGTYGGGWYMTDSTYIRAYGDKYVYTGGVMQADGGMNSSSFNYTSDRRLKKNIVAIEAPLEKLLSLRGVNFDWRKNDQHDVGFIAQEVEKVLPEVVSEQHNGADGSGYKAVKYGNIIAVVVEGFKSMYHDFSTHLGVVDQQVADLQAQNSQLRARQAELETENARLRSTQSEFDQRLKTLEASLPVRQPASTK